MRSVHLERDRVYTKADNVLCAGIFSLEFRVVVNG